MNKPPISLCYPTYVVEYAIIDSSVEFMNRGNLNVGGEWLGSVPRLAICKDTENNNYYLAHCANNWELMCMVEEHATLEKSKANAEKHYKGISNKWVKTSYKKKEARQVFRKEREEMKCSFCGKSHYDHDFESLIFGNDAKICDKCLIGFSKQLSSNESS